MKNRSLAKKSVKMNLERHSTGSDQICSSRTGGKTWVKFRTSSILGLSQKDSTDQKNFTFTFHFPALEKEMATRSSVLAWRIPGTGEPGGLPSMGSHRVGHD